MLFNSMEFLLFFPVVVLIFFIIPKRWRHLWLLAASWFFYASWNVKYIILLLFCTTVTYLCGLGLEKIGQKSWEEPVKQKRKKIVLVLGIVLNFAVLFFFKYFQFFADIVNMVLNPFGVRLPDAARRLLLPVGISFYTFQALGYTIDVYRGDIYAEKNFFRYALFVSFFPQLVAGPIERSKNLLKQLSSPAGFEMERVRDGFLLMLWGYFMKVVIADRIAIFVDCVYGSPDTYEGLFLVIATVLFAVQIYCDFAGYSVIALGAAKIMGIELMENFDAPYLAGSVAGFWRRWHISLFMWFRDYLYIPLGGNRRGTPSKYVNLMVVFLASGLWHGADWTFVIWGALNGLFQIAGDAARGLKKRVNTALHMKPDSFSHRLLQVFFTFLLIDFTWIFFRAPSLSAAVAVIRSILTVHNPWILFDGSLYTCGLAAGEFWMMLVCIGVLFAADAVHVRGISLRKILVRQEYWFRWLVIAGTVLLILLVGIWGTEYNGTGFIYFQF